MDEFLYGVLALLVAVLIYYFYSLQSASSAAASNFNAANSNIGYVGASYLPFKQAQILGGIPKDN